MISLEFNFSAEVWLYSDKVAWHFITLPQAAAEEISFFQEKRTGFGSVKVKARIGTSVWRTSIFPYKAAQSYILPLKAEVRKREGIVLGDTVDATLYTGL